MIASLERNAIHRASGLECAKKRRAGKDSREISKRAHEKIEKKRLKIQREKIGPNPTRMSRLIPQAR